MRTKLPTPEKNKTVRNNLLSSYLRCQVNPAKITNPQITMYLSPNGTLFKYSSNIAKIKLPIKI